MKPKRNYDLKGTKINYLDKSIFTVEYTSENSFGLWYMTTENKWIYSDDIR